MVLTGRNRRTSPTTNRRILRCLLMLDRVRIPSPNFSRRNAAVSTVVLHTAEGATTFQGLGAFFSRPSSGVSSHVGIDDQVGVVGEYVGRAFKAWTASAANPWSVQAELCGFARWSRAEWLGHPVMLANTATWIAEECAVFGIPVVGLDPAGAQAPGVKGVCQHADLGRMGGGHWDCGPGFPFDHVLDMARGARPSEDDQVTDEDFRRIAEIVRLQATAAARDVARQTWGVPADTQDSALQMTILGRISGTTSDAVVAKLPEP